MRAIAALVLAAPLLCAAQPDAPLARPDVKAGDRWTYQRMDYDAGKRRARFEIEVVFADRGVIQVVSTQLWKAGEVDMTFTSDWNYVSSFEIVFYPHTGWLKFPLRVGDTYDAAYEMMVAKKGLKARNAHKAKVVGWEEVAVPAGKFRALKVVSEGHSQSLTDTFYSASQRSVIWYVPEVKRWVKRTLETRPTGRGGAGEHTGEELVFYKLQ